jgi:hypothetical protein
MISFFLKNISKTTFFYSGLRGDIFLDISVTPFLFCNRNNFYIVDILLYLNNFKRILFFLQLLFLNKNNIFLLYESQHNLLFMFNKKFEATHTYFSNINKIKYKFNNNYKFIFFNLYLKEIYEQSHYKFFNFFKFYSKSLKFFKFKKFSNKLKLSNYKLLSFFNNLSKRVFLYKYNSNKVVSFYWFYNKKKFNIVMFDFFVDSLFFFKVNNILVLDDKLILVKNIFLRNYYFLTKYLVLNIFVKNNSNLNNFYNYLNLNEKFKYNYNFFLRLKFKKKFKSLKHLIFLYKRTLSIKFYLFDKIKTLKYWLRRESSSIFIFQKKNYNLLKILKNLLIYYKFFNIFNRKIYHFKNIKFDKSDTSPLINRKFNIFYKKYFHFYGERWKNGSLTNFYGVKNSFSYINKTIPNFFLLIYMSNTESLIKESSLLGLPVIGFFDISQNLSYLQYYVLTNNLDTDLNIFYYNLLLESYFRSFIVELNNFQI